MSSSDTGTAPLSSLRSGEKTTVQSVSRVIVLWRAVAFALPAGAVIWLISNVQYGGVSVAEHAIRWLDPFALMIGLNGVILLAYLVAQLARLAA